MAHVSTDQLLQLETTCGSFLYELQIIWDEVGETDTERDKMLLELEQECLEVYRRKVDQANRYRAQLRQTIADSEAELAAICSAMGEPPVHTKQPTQRVGNLKEELNSITPQLEEMRKRKGERLKQFLEVMEQIRNISVEVMPSEYSPSRHVDESDLSIRKLEELYRQLESLQKEKNDRLKQIMDHLSTLNELCSVLGVAFKETVREIHPTLDDTEASKSISNVTIERLATAIGRLREIKIERMQKLQDLASTMLELWNLMDTPIEEQQLFQNVTCNIAASEEEITESNTLSVDFLSYVEEEVLRLEQLKVSKMKELVLKKKTELEELRRQGHLVVEEAENEPEVAISAIESGAIDASFVLNQIEGQIAEVKEEAFSRKDILERVEKWLAACEEEAWLEEYNRDENRYNAGRGAHLTLKRAEKARALINKIPGMVDTLVAKITQWEKERGIGFTYDGVRLLTMLGEYTIVRQEKEQERKRQRDQKKLQGQLIAEQEALYGSKPSPSKPQSAKKVPRTSTGGSNRRLSFGGAATLQTPKPDYMHSAKSTRTAKKLDDLGTLSPGSRGLDIAGLPVKKLSYNDAITKHQEVGMPRKPFASLIPVNTIPSAPSMPVIASTLEENQAPNTMLLLTPKNPATAAAVPMHVASTPAPTCLVNDGKLSVVASVEETEYSFEERRLAFYVGGR
ncbi:65-kDa microtubule-associated protein 3-like isoform X1 [Zingiber officinale]|uniref:65-kDa microtubule-associated protein 3-like isoform X1 n=1 Tax=Zingiber officinale TaxID=94328 RepID=UPI001C4C5F69|nr:65-kDa microtubule-associated protein 3-like isoform X1 [Zingiber officinale]